MRVFEVVYKKTNYLKGIVLLICIFATVTLSSGCNRKVGVKPGEQLKANKSKCKCRKHNGGIYSEVPNQKSTFSFFEISSGKVFKG
jgi:hypothetical protein